MSDKADAELPAPRGTDRSHGVRVASRRTANARVVELEAAPEALKLLGGSQCRSFNETLLASVLGCMSVPEEGEDELQRRVAATQAALAAFKPADEIKGMIAAQAVAMHHASMECFRRAALPNQHPDTESKLRRDGANLSRGMTEMLEALSRRRDRSPQVVRVERVVVADGGQAIVGAVTAGVGGRGTRMADEVQDPVKCRCGARTRAGTTCMRWPVAGRKRCRLHGGCSAGPQTAEGLERLRKARTIHGGSSAEMRRLRALIRELRAETDRLVELA